MATLIDDLRAQVVRLKGQGHTAVSLDQLDQYLASRETVPPTTAEPSDWEKFRHVSSLVHESALHTAQATLNAGLATLKATILINGGAAVALLAFLGNVLAKEARTVKVSIPGIRWALEIFVSGVFCSAVALAWRYFSIYSESMMLIRQNARESTKDEAVRVKARQSEGRWAKFWGACTLLAILFGVGSIAAFIWGGIQAAHSVW